MVIPATATDFEPNVLAGTELNVLTREYQVEVRAALKGKVVAGNPAVANAGPTSVSVYAVFKTGQVELSRQYIAVTAVRRTQGAGCSVRWWQRRASDRIGLTDDDIIYSGPVPSGTLSLEFPGRASGESVVWDVKYR